MRAALAVLALFLAACLYVVKDNRKEIDTMTSRTVSVECVRARGSAVALGTVPSGSLYATAYHVIEDEENCLVLGLPVQVVGTDEENDLALLLGAPQGDSPLAYAEPFLGMDVWALGYAKQRVTNEAGLQITRGVLVSQAGPFWRVSASFYFGASGGPVFDAEGRLVGIISAFLGVDRVPMDDHYFISPAKKVEEMARRFTENFKVEELACRCGVPVPESLYSQAMEVTRRAQVLRDHLGSPLYVVSGYRTRDWNARVGGASGSLHLHAGALDLRSWDHTPAELAAAYGELVASGKVPDGGLGVYSGHVHIDIGKPRRW